MCGILGYNISGMWGRYDRWVLSRVCGDGVKVRMV